MNDVLNPFQQIPHPTSIQTSLLAGALFSKFDPSGRWIAAGKSNGSVIIWDLNTKAPIRVCDGHVRGVTSVDWSRYGRYILSSSKDWNVIVWDLAKKQYWSSGGSGAGPGPGGEGEEEDMVVPLQRMRTVRFDSGVMGAAFHPRNSKIILTLLSTGELFITDLRRREYRGRVELCDTLHYEKEHQAEKYKDKEDGEADGEGGSAEGNNNANGNNSVDRERERRRARARPPITVARFDVLGRYVFAGTANGMLLVFNTRTKSMVGRHKITGAGVMKSLDFAKNGRRLVINSSDRTLRQFTIPNYSQQLPISNSSSTPSSSTSGLVVNEQELEPTHRFNDPINKTAWHVMAYSPDGEWLAGGSADPATHKIYIWDLSNDGQFSTALDGGREPLAHIHWHPTKSLIASTTTHGNILVWHCPKAERWGAFAGGFEEVDENIEYEEREDEFDIEDEEVMQERKMKAEEEDVDVDAMNTSADALSSPIVPTRSSNTSGTSTTAGGGNGGGGTNSTTSTPRKPLSSASTDNNFNNNSNVHHSKINANKPNSKTKDAGGKVVVDGDMAWADEDSDDDVKGWKMHVGKGAAELAEELGL